ncbi:MAG: PKD domain-containing protein, partial [bacterium]
MGVVIENNDFYVTPDIYLDVNGQKDINGPLSCSENAIDIKIANNTEDPDNQLLIVKNRFWGYRKSYHGTVSCTNNGSSNAPAVAIHFDESDYILIKDNIVTDSESGIAITGNGFDDKPDHISIVGNYLYDVSNKSNPRGALILDRGDKVEAYFNSIIQSEVLWDLAFNGGADIRANLVVKTEDTRGSTGGTTNTSHQVYLDNAEVLSNGNDSIHDVQTRVSGAMVVAGDLLYADNALPCTDGNQDGCVIYKALTGGVLAASRPVLPVTCGESVQDGSVTLQAVLCACTYHRKLISGPELRAIPYCKSAQLSSPAFAAVTASTEIGVATDRGIDNSLPPGPGTQASLWEGLDIPAYAGAMQGFIPADAAIADAGVDFSAPETSLVVLDASSSLPAGMLSYLWAQTGGPMVSLNNSTSASPDFVAPAVLEKTRLTFALTVTGTVQPTDTDSVKVSIEIIDTDSDGLSDLWEIDVFGSIAVHEGQGDADGDGITNVDESIAGSNPVDGDLNGNLVLDAGDLLLLLRHLMNHI